MRALHINFLLRQQSRQSGRRGFTMIEMLVAAAISVFLIGGATVALINAVRFWRAEAIRSELHMDLETALERIRHDLRLSSVGIGLMAFYPADAAAYTAISFPLASPGADGLLERDENNDIIWDTTVIYHVRPGSPDELIRTTFHPRNENAASEDFYLQLESTVQATTTAGVQAAALDDEVAESRIVFRNLVEMVFRPPDLLFDGYAPQYGRARSFNWGGIVLSNGVNELTFTVRGRNAASDPEGYKVGIDRFALSYSGSPREGEMVLPVHNHPVAPYYSYEINRGAVEAEDMSEYGASWSGNSQLTFLPPIGNAEGASITFHVENDLWCDANFDSPPGVLASNCNRRLVRAFEDIEPHIADFVVAMDSSRVWDAVFGFASDEPLEASNLSLASDDTQFINIIYGGAGGQSTITMDGSWVRFEFSAGTDRGLIVRNPRLSRRLSDDQSVPGSEAVLTFNDGNNSAAYIPAGNVRKTDWIRYEIDGAESYLLRWERMPGSFIGNWYDTHYNRARVWSNQDVDQEGNPHVMSYINGEPDNRLIALSAVEVFTTNAVYRSGVFDTRVASPAYRELLWTRHDPADVAGDIALRIRSADRRDMKDGSGNDVLWYPAGGFNNHAGNDISAISGGRYVQYEVLFSAWGEQHRPPILRDVTITWDAPTGIADLIVDFARGPDYGIIGADVNGQSFVKGIEVEMEIFRDGPFGEERVSGVAEVRPLNTDR